MEKNTEALKKLYSGPEILLVKSKKFRDLGAKTTKQIDEESIEELLKIIFKKYTYSGIHNVVPTKPSKLSSGISSSF